MEACKPQMTVGDLREMIKDIPDDVVVMYVSFPPLGGFMYEDACTTDSGLHELGEPEEGELGPAMTVFAIMPHNQTTTEEPDES
jgi:hypothetical protein